MKRRITPLKRKKLLQKLRKLGCTGPHFGRKHQKVFYFGKYSRVPNPHKGDIDPRIIKEILKELDISVSDFLDA